MDKAPNSPVKLRKARWSNTIVTLYMRGYSQQEVADEATKIEGHKFHRTYVGKVIDKAIADCIAQKSALIQDYIAVEIQKLNRLEREYWEAWDRSTKQQKKGGKMVKTEAGEHEFLKGVERCIEKRMKFLGPGDPMAGATATAALQVNNYNNGEKTSSTTIIRRTIFQTRETTTQQIIEE